MSSKVTRMLTQSDYDHVAMVLKFDEDKEVYFLEATTEGVSMTAWSVLKTYSDILYSRVVIRHLHANRDEQMMEELAAFVDKAVGKKYQINATKLLVRESNIVNKGEIMEEDRTFFCSELVAKAYKTLGFINCGGKCSSRFYPSHFSTHHKK